MHNILDLIDVRKVETPQIWVVGCSIAHGIGLDFSSQRYGQIVGNHFEVATSFLTQGGTSIEWAVDQILRSDIRQGDTVIWGITGVNRFVHWNDEGTMFSVTPAIFDPANPHFEISTKHIKDKRDLWLELMHDNSRLYHSIRQISQVIGFCNKIQANLVMGCHLELSMKKQSEHLEKFLQSTNHYVSLPHRSSAWEYTRPNDYRQYIDKGNDNQHPGPLTHKQWAEILIKYIEDKGYINEA